MKKVDRDQVLDQISRSLKENRVTALIGSRQVGKTTLARQLQKKQKESHFFDLEDPTDFALLQNPKLALEQLEGLIIIDEIQRVPELFPYLRVKADAMKAKSKILILGSSSRELIEQASESLAGRIAYIEISGFSISEVEKENELFLRGGYPLSFLAKTNDQSFRWRQNFLQSFVERDLRALGIDLPPQSLRRLLEMLAGYHGQILNTSELGKSMGFSHTTARKYVDILAATFLLRELKPWHQNILQRQVKQSKIYFRDSGLVHSLLGITSQAELSRFPRLGSLWEGFALQQACQALSVRAQDLYFWSLHQNGELDLFVRSGDQKIGFEFKYSDKPTPTSSMSKAIELLKLDQLYLVYPGTKKSAVAERMTALPLTEVETLKL